MRLLNARTRHLEEFVGDDIPRYAILSHTWGPDELTYDNIARSERVPSNVKIDGCCRKALSHNLSYVWIDTICINKNSSAELSEAINSMFEWYRASAMCYAYLPDVSSVPNPDMELGDYAYFEHEESEFCRSRWFTRGWTLQELLAPKTVQFYDGRWNFISQKNERRFDVPDIYNDDPYLRSVSRKDHWFYTAVARITGIPRLVLQGETRLEEVCIAARMAWAANRQTTRKEDIAYCLMGIFGVNMAMLYGEGDRAFIRLQEEIIWKSDDESIFAWGFGSIGETRSTSTRFLASSPADFKGCDGVWKGLNKPEPAGSVSHRSYWESDISPHYSLTNKGLLIERRLLVLPPPFNAVVMPLNCSAPCEVGRSRETTTNRILALPLRGVARQGGRLWPDHWRRPITLDAGVFNSYASPVFQVYVDTQARHRTTSYRALRLCSRTCEESLSSKPKVLEMYPSWWFLTPPQDTPRFLGLRIQEDRLRPAPEWEHVLLRLVTPGDNQAYLIHLRFQFGFTEYQDEWEDWPHRFISTISGDCELMEQPEGDVALAQQLIETPKHMADFLNSGSWPRASQDGRVNLEMQFEDGDLTLTVINHSMKNPGCSCDTSEPPL